MSRVFMEAYAAKAADKQTLQQLLRMKFLTKALYDNNCEAGFRPTWVNAPVKGVLPLLDEMDMAQ